MKQIRNYGDERQVEACAHCGGTIETRDHVPSKVLLDERYPGDLPVVWACAKCNGGLSADEEYVACLVECSISGSADPDVVSRPKVARILRERPRLASMLARARTQDGEDVRFEIDHDRVERVLLKLARGHALYELNERMTTPPTTCVFKPIPAMEGGERESFERVLETAIWPEVGSRAMHRMVEVGGGWIEVQPGRYRYHAWADGSVGVRLVISEYLAAEVLWCG